MNIQNARNVVRHPDVNTETSPQPRILIAENEPAVADCMKAILSNDGYRSITVVASVKDAVENAVSVRTDLILMNSKLMNDLDDVIIHDRNLEDVDIPVLFVNANLGGNTTEAMKVKPGENAIRMISLFELTNGVAEALAGRGFHQAIPYE